MSDGRCNCSNAEAGVLMAIPRHGPTPSVGGKQLVAKSCAMAGAVWNMRSVVTAFFKSPDCGCCSNNVVMQLCSNGGCRSCFCVH
ncbi:hypothetical protein AVEN_222896-1, partial [Araneus ventricosus]